MKCMWKRLCFSSQAFTFGMFVRGVIVHDQMQLKMPGGFAIDLFEKFQPLLMSALALDTADQTPLKIIQCGDKVTVP